MTVQNLSPFISALVIAAYLSAAFLDCEPLEPIPFWNGRLTSEAAAHETNGHVGHAAHGAQSGAVQTAHSSPNHHASHSSSEADSPRRAPSFRDLRAKGLVFTATCLCGCSDTRGVVGGNASRLGAVVPGVYLARLVELEPLVAVASHAGMLFEIHSDLDPIPI